MDEPSYLSQGDLVEVDFAMTDQDDDLFEAAFARHEVGQVAIDDEGRVSAVSGVVLRWLGVERERVIGQSAWRWTPTVSAPTWAPYWSQLRDEGVLRVRFRFKGAHQRYTAVEGHALHLTRSGREHAVFLLHRDDRVEGDARGKGDERLELMLNSGSDGFWEHDLVTDSFYSSPAYALMLGLDTGPLDFTSLIERVHPDDRARLRAMRDRLVSGEIDEGSFEHRLRHAEGHYVWMLARPKIIRGEDGEPLRVMGLAVDITARKAAEVALRRERDLFEAMMSTNATAFVVVDTDNQVSFANRSATRMMGMEIAEFHDTVRQRADWPVYNLDGELASDTEIPSQIVLATGEPVAERWLYLGAPDGRRTLVSCNGAPVFGEDGELVCAVVAMTDITARVAAERSLAESARHLRETLEQLPIGVCVISPDGVIQECNGSFTRLVGVGRQVIGQDARRVSEVLRTEDGAPIVFPSHPIFAPWFEHRAARGLVLHWVDTDGEKRWVMTDLIPRFADGGELSDVLCTATDITYRRRVEASLMQAQKVESLGRLATGIAHDFNNLLTAVLGGADLVAELLDPDLPVQADLARIVEAAERGAALTHQLLGYARRQPVQPKVLRMSTQVRRAAEMIQRVIREDIRLVVDVLAEDARVRLDDSQLDQVLLNLAVNARDAMPSGGTLTLRVDREPTLATTVPGPRVAIRVVDTGGGIPLAIRERIFEPFFTTKPVGEGTGLGLATCFGIIAQHGGHIAVDSGAWGTCFEVTLPQVDDEPDTALAAAPRRRVVGSGTVLLIEDDEMVREMARRALERAGYTVVEAADGDSALALTADGVEYDAVVTDVVMPGVDGRALSEALDATRRVPVLFTSGHADSLLGERGIIRAGVNFLRKPYSAEALCERVEMMLATTLDLPAVVAT